MESKQGRGKNITPQQSLEMIFDDSDENDVTEEFDDDIAGCNYVPDLESHAGTSQSSSDEAEIEEDCSKSTEETLVLFTDSDKCDEQTQVSSRPNTFKGFQEKPAGIEVQISVTGTRKKQSTPSRWKRNQQAELTKKGKEHTTRKGNLILAKGPKPSDCNRCRYKCDKNFTEEERKSICQEYWELGDYSRKKDFILSRINKKQVERRRTEDESKQRASTIVYSFKKPDGTLNRVCKNFFTKTLDISNNVIYTAIKGCSDVGTFQGKDKRGKRPPPNKTKDENVAIVKRHIESFPQIESHYTRSDTKRKYLCPTLSIAKMYHLYKEKCESATPPLTVVSEKIYRNIFCTNFNLSFYQPKKDQCTKCKKYEMLKGTF